MTFPLYWTEEELQASLVSYARNEGWAVHFVPDALYRRSFIHKGKRGSAIDLGDRGFPDLVLVRDGVIWFRELKVKKNVLSANQKTWRDILIAAGCDWALWHPKTMDDVRFLEQLLREGQHG